jgi:hypothetical protein
LVQLSKSIDHRRVDVIEVVAASRAGGSHASGGIRPSADYVPSVGHAARSTAECGCGRSMRLARYPRVPRGLEARDTRQIAGRTVAGVQGEGRSSGPYRISEQARTRNLLGNEAQISESGVKTPEVSRLRICARAKDAEPND